MTQWLDDAQQSAWRKLIEVVELLPGSLDSQLRRDADLSHFDYFTLAMLSEAPNRSLRMTALAELTNSTLPRLSHVASRLEERGYLERTPCPTDRRATNATLTEQGWRKLTINWTIFFACMAVLNEAVWRNTTWDFWVGFKLWGAIPLTLLFAFANIPMLLKHGLQTGDKAVTDLPPEG